MFFLDKDKDKVDKGETAGGDGNDTQEVQGSRVRQTHPASSEYAKATVCINLASLFALRSEWDNARQCLRKVNVIVLLKNITKTIFCPNYTLDSLDKA